MDDDFGLNFDQKKNVITNRAFETFSSVRSCVCVRRSDRGREEDAKHDDSVDRRGPSRLRDDDENRSLRRIQNQSNFFSIHS